MDVEARRNLQALDAIAQDDRVTQRSLADQLGMALGLDLVRSMYRVALARSRPQERQAHAAQVVDLFMRLHAHPDEHGPPG